jgi:transcriptional regulator with XRE-family HTH domain
MKEPCQFGSRLREARTEKQLSQNALAGMVGLTAMYVSLLERGTRAPSYQVMLDLAKALDTTVSKLTEGI